MKNIIITYMKICSKQDGNELLGILTQIIYFTDDFII